MRGVIRILSVLTVAASLLALAGCGQKTNCSGVTFGGSGSSGSGGGTAGSSSCGTGGGSGGSVLDYLFFVNNTSIDAAYFTGTSLLPLTSFQSPSLGSGGAADMVISGNFLYQTFAPSAGGGQIFAYTIGSNGSLTQIGSGPVTTTDAADPIAVDPKGRFLFLAQNISGTVGAMQINSSTGALTPAPSPSPLLELAEQLVVDGTGHYLYAELQNASGVVEGFSIDQTTGALSVLPGSPYFVGTSRLAAHPSGNFLIGTGAGVLTTIPINTATGDLSTGASYVPSSVPNEVLMHPSGNFLYAFTEPASAIQGYAVDGSGNLTPLSNSPFTSITSINRAQFNATGTTMIGVTSSPYFFAVVVDPSTGALTAPAPAYSGTSSYVFAVN